MSQTGHDSLSDDFIDALLIERPKPKIEGKHVDTPVKSKSRPKLAIVFDPEHSRQEGPVRYFDKEMRCASRGCSSSTYIKVQGIPKCTAHALKDCNTMLVEAGFRGIG